ncbi:MAG TPA: transposase [Acidimicrobiales bacterium]|nr:transposase [Acidimicrobiales bacterium]
MLVAGFMVQFWQKIDSFSTGRPGRASLSSWRSEIIAHHRTGTSNGPTEGLNLAVKKVKRCGHGFRSFENYRLRVPASSRRH